MSFNNIPEEMRIYNQWIVWKYENVDNKITKIPYAPKALFMSYKASVTDNSSWTDFYTAINAVRMGYDGIGFVFTQNDPYTFIDLDNPFDEKHGYSNEKAQEIVAKHNQITDYFNSYSEISPSGRGLHIIAKGSVPSGRRRECVEIYSSERYATFTGNVYKNTIINYAAPQIKELWGYLAPKNSLIVVSDQPQQFEDNEIIRKALAAKNGEHFSKLLNGDWAFMGNVSQSEADLAFVNIIGFYSRNKDQIKRIFLQSTLGNRKKANRADYVDSMISKSFDNYLPVLNLDIYHENLKSIALPTEEDLEEPYVLPQSPGGLMGRIANYIYNSAFSPVPEIAIAGAIGLMAGICGRAYNVNGSGLNQYVIMLAQTGAGKEAPATAIDKIIEKVRQTVPTAGNFRGPTEIASGQALRKHLTKKSACFVSILGEFGLRLQSLSSVRANPHELMIKRLLLDLYNKSGKGRVLGEGIYADAGNNADIVNSPAFSILCESTQETFYNCLTEAMIKDGLLPRFTIIEYKGGLPEVNYNSGNVQVPQDIVNDIANLIVQVETLTHRGVVIDVEFTPSAEEKHKNYNKHIRSILSKSKSEATAELYNRAHMNVLRLAALVAVGKNYLMPVIDDECMNWAIDLVNVGIRSIKKRFDLGEVGEEVADIKQINALKKAIIQYFTNSATYGCDINMKTACIIPYNYLIRKLIGASNFKGDRAGATTAVKRAIQTFIEQDVIREVSKPELIEKFNTTQRAFVVNDWNYIKEKGA